MFLSDFDFDLPEELIAIRPVKPRSSARLLVAKENKICDSFVDNLPKFLKSGDRLVLNDTKVLPARLNGVRSRSIEGSEISSAKIEVTLLATKQKGIWSALIKPLRKVKLEETIHFNKSFNAKLIDKVYGQGLLEFNSDGSEFIRYLEKSSRN